MSSAKKLMGTTAVGGALAIEDVFSTYLYTGNGSTQTITNGIDLAGEGGLVWIKNRVAASNHALYDTERGVRNYLSSNLTSAQDTASSGSGLTAFNSNGFTLGTSWLDENTSGQNVASWTWRKAPRWFDVVTYTGDGIAGRTIAHNLGTDVGSIFVKKTSGADAWAVWHRGANGGNAVLVLNSTAAQNTNGRFWWGDNTSYIAPTSTEFTVATDGQVNASGATYVAYLFAHDPLGPSGDGSDGLIACGSYTEGASAQQIDLGWEPQFVIAKPYSGAGHWEMFDTMRGMNNTNLVRVRANEADAEASFGSPYFIPNATGFTAPSGFFGNGTGIIYIAIRRGPMRQPTSGTEVFATDYNTGSAPSYISNFPVDFMINKNPSGGSNKAYARLLGAKLMYTDATNAETSDPAVVFDYMNGAINNAGDTGHFAWMFRRAPGFFDVVAYTGNSSTNNLNHNLSAIPEMFIVKNRNTSNYNWFVYHKDLGNTTSQALTSAAALSPNTTIWDSTTPTDSVFTVGNNANVNNSGDTYIAYLFATLLGVSKVGSYTGNGTSQTINCGFTSGARFVLIKRTDSTGDWYVWDTERGIVAANDPHLSLNTTAAEVTTDDSVDPDSSGFIVNQDAATNINVSSASYIFYAVS